MTTRPTLAGTSAASRPRRASGENFLTLARLKREGFDRLGYELLEARRAAPGPGGREREIKMYMSSESLLIILVVGVVAGWLAGQIIQGTGFGLIGHAREMAMGSGMSLRLFASAVPLLSGALECVARGFVPGGLQTNRAFASCCVECDASVP